MSISEMIKRGILVQNRCPACGGVVRHGFGIGTIECPSCKYDDDWKDDLWNRLMTKGERN